ncbi:MAG TPA: biotin/lipoyl-containing protein [Anaerolineae bacterium]|nr:biotin/lipoyl-containing protein [Anaerolineae bacterium]
MKITVKVDNQSYEVEVGDIHDRPVVAVIEGEAFEVWPDEVVISHPSTHSHAVPLQAAPKSSPAPKAAAPVTAPTASSDNAKAVRAPIPGVIISVAVKAGDVVKHGQELCVLEAMKMKNVIRASRAGTIGVVHTAAQQHVKHHDVLMEYTD